MLDAQNYYQASSQAEDPSVVRSRLNCCTLLSESYSLVVAIRKVQDQLSCNIQNISRQVLIGCSIICK